MAEAWYYQHGGQAVGPVSRDELAAMAKSGEITPSVLVWHEAMESWAPAGSIRFAGKPQVPSPPPLPRTSATRSSSRRPHLKTGNEIWIGASVCVVLFFIAVGCIVASSTSRQPAPPHRAQQATVTSLPSSQNQPTLRTTQHENRPAQATNAIDVERHSDPLPDEQLVLSLPPETFPTSVANSIETKPVPDNPARPTEVVVDSPQSPSTLDPKENEIEPEPTTHVARVEVADEPIELYQEIAVARKPSFVVQGLSMSQDIQYGILSRTQISPVRKDGKRTVSQIVVNTRLEKADALTRASFERSLRDLIGQQFSFTLNDRHDVIEFTGHKDTRKAIEAKPEGFEGFMITSVMDEDGWKEIAQLSFFKPDEQAANGTWQRQMTHDWDALGSWYGRTTFRRGPRSQQADQYNYWHEMTYKPPADGVGGLPFDISSARFETQQAGGTIHFDPKLGRVVMAQEMFRTRGLLETQVLGQASRVQVDEQQRMVVRLFDQNPWKQ